MERVEQIKKIKNFGRCKCHYKKRVTNGVALGTTKRGGEKMTHHWKHKVNK